MVYIMLAKKKVRGYRLALTCAAMLVFQVCLVYVTTVEPEGMTFLVWLFIRILFYLAGMWGFLWLCCEAPPLEISYLCLRSFLLAELAWAVLFEGYQTLLGYPIYVTGSFQWILIWIVYGIIYGAMYLLERTFLSKVENSRITCREFGMLLLITGVTFVLTSFFASNDSTVLGGKITMSHTLVDVFGIVFVFEYRLWFANMQAKQELKIISKVMENQTDQYKNFQESMELVNRKYHDLKQVLFVLRSELNSELSREEKQRWLEDFEKDIKGYEACYKTGNTVVDTVLSEKQMYCLRHGIEMSCSVQGEFLGGMEAIDICTIFGNALDNAIEYVSGLSEEEHRLIHIYAFEKQGFLNIRFENICKNFPHMENGIPSTTKAEKDYHGYGIKSIQYVVRKYGGVLSIDYKNGWFRLKVLLPLPLKKTEYIQDR